MGRWFSRLRSPFVPFDEVRTEAQIDLRDGLLEARADRIAELLAELERARGREARLTAELATYKAQDFMRQALRYRRRQAEEQQRRGNR